MAEPLEPRYSVFTGDPRHLQGRAVSRFSSFGFLVMVSQRSAHSCGSFTLYRSRLIFNCSWVELNGSFLIAKFSDQGFFYRNACIYAPNRNPDRDTFTSCTDLVDLAVPTVLCGDFNAVFDRALDCWGVAAGSLYHNSSSALALLFCTCCVIDTWRYLHPDSISFLWMRPDGAHASRIDFFGCPVSWISGD